MTNSIDVSIRVESAADWPAIRDVNGRAFGRDNEARLVEALRGTSDFAPALSLVAVDGGRVVGHILFSRIRIRSPEGAKPHSRFWIHLALQSLRTACTIRS